MISVLLVDDEPVLLDIGRMFLERLGEFQIGEATSGKEALEQLRTGSYDVIVADYEMPEMDGLTLLRKIRDSWSDLPFILFTGRGREEIVIEALNNGADFYLQKGGDPKNQFHELAQKIKVAVNTRKSSQNNELRLHAILDLYNISDSSLKEVTDFALEQAISITNSMQGYLAFVNEDESFLTLYSWSGDAMNKPVIQEKPITYEIAMIGCWGDAIRERRPVITNHYDTDISGKQELPVNYHPIFRHMNVPILEKNRIVLLSGVVNKKEPYTDDDIFHLTVLMTSMWGIVRRKKTEEILQKKYSDLLIAYNQLKALKMNVTPGSASR